MLSTTHHAREDFLDLLVTAWLSDRSSQLYYEIQNNGYLAAGGWRYRIEVENEILKYFLADARRAEELGVWKPFGEDSLRELDRLRLISEQDRYLKPLDSYIESERWRCRFHATIRFFDIMVLEALHQKIEWHMWLYYMPHITRDIVRNLNSLRADADVDLEAEFPTPYHFLLYEIVDAHRKWITALEDVPEDQANAMIAGTGPDHENGSIGKSAILSLGACLYHVLMSDAVTDRFKTYLLEIIFRLPKELRHAPKTARAAETLARSITSGGVYRVKPGDDYSRVLERLVPEIDSLLRFELRDDAVLGPLCDGRTPRS